MDYNAILRDATSLRIEKQHAFTTFFKIHKTRGNKFILFLLNRYIPFLPNKTEVADDIYAVVMSKIYDKIITNNDNKRYLQRRTCEDLFCGIAKFDIRNLQRSQQNVGTTETTSMYSDQETKTSRFDYLSELNDDILLKIFGNQNNIEIEQHQTFIHKAIATLTKNEELSKTCQVIFSHILFLYDVKSAINTEKKEPLSDRITLFEFFKEYRLATNKSVPNENSFDVTLNECRKKVRNLREKYNLSFLNFFKKDKNQ